MTEYSKGKTIVIGYKNPDMDSICSAICHANLKQAVTGEDSEPRRAGRANEETRFVLKHFGVRAPELTEYVKAEIRDIEIHEVEGVKKNISLKKTWNLMQTTNTVALPTVTSDGMPGGLITVGNTTQSYMNVCNNSILSKANVQYSNIIKVLEGSLVVDSTDIYFNDEKALIAAANPNMMEYCIAKNDLVILGDWYESQLCTIEMDATRIIVCEGAPVSMIIKKLAQERGCTVITAPCDTYTAIRLINQSMPISYFMMKDNLTTFGEMDVIDDIKEMMANKRHRGSPTLDKDGKYKGMVSRRNPLGARGRSLILVDHNGKTQAVDGVENVRILETINHHRLGTIGTISPVFFRNQSFGCMVTTIYQMYQEAGVKTEKEITGLLCSAIISDTLPFRFPTCTRVDEQTGLILVKIAGIGANEYATEMFTAGSNSKNKLDGETFYQDFKRFTSGEISFGAGQISSLDQKKLDKLRVRIVPYLVEAHKEHGVDMMFFMLTNILTESITLLCEGMRVGSIVLSVFRIDVEENGDKKDEIVELEGVVSRKEQLIPAIGMALQGQEK